MKKKLLIAVALAGFLLMLTERDGGPWAGSVIGAAMMCVGVLVVLQVCGKEGIK